MSVKETRNIKENVSIALRSRFPGEQVHLLTPDLHLPFQDLSLRVDNDNMNENGLLRKRFVKNLDLSEATTKFSNLSVAASVISIYRISASGFLWERERGGRRFLESTQE